jgi:cyclic di-GMP phosphodiesterase Gmr
VIARIGGNDFGIFMRKRRSGISDVSNIGGAGACHTLSAPIRLSNLTISVNCAIGCSLVADQATRTRTSWSVRRRPPRGSRRTADGSRSIARGSLGAARQRFFLESRLRDALARDGLTLSYQPMVELASGAGDRLRGAGAVAGCRIWVPWSHRRISFRWRKSPALSCSWGGGLCMRPLRQMKVLGRPSTKPRCRLKVSVNLSSIQIARDDVAAMVADALGS